MHIARNTLLIGTNKNNIGGVVTRSGRGLKMFALARGSFFNFPPKLKILDKTLPLTRGPGNHRLRVGGFNSNLSFVLWSPTWLIKLLVSRERNRHHNSRLIRGALILLKWHQTSVWKQVDLPEPVGTDRKTPTTLPQYKRSDFSTLERA